MSAADCFLDTNVLLYLLSKDAAKADRAEALFATCGIVSVQVLNEFASVATRKLRRRQFRYWRNGLMFVNTFSKRN
jgi:predicted nucleic acid-binding protein